MEYLINLAILFAIYAILGMSLNLVVGYTGLLSVTHAAFYGIGAYTTAILLTKTEIGFFTSMIFGMIIASIVSFLIGLVLSRFKDDYFNVIVFSIFLNWQSLTR
jgi:branched-chain amino acid transport system permease protein